MYTYLARQPIFNKDNTIYGYELLYRTGENNNFSGEVNGSIATKNLISDVFSVFGLDNITDSKYAFLNFTEELILEKYPLLLKSNKIVIELLEDISVTESLIDYVKELKQNGFMIAIDDYVGDSSFDPIIPYVDIIKVDFMLTTKEKQKEIAEKLAYKNCLLAEKIETLEDFDYASSLGYTYFQGFFYSKPKVFKKKEEMINPTVFCSLMNYLSQKNVDFEKVSDIISTDPVLTYKFIKKINTAQYFSNQPITQIKNALVRMGVKPLKRWLILIFSHTNNKTVSNEINKQAFFRGLFLEELMKVTNYSEYSENGFLLGILSLMDIILNESIDVILKDIDLPKGIKEALIGQENNYYSKFLDFAKSYEKDDCCFLLDELGIKISDDELCKLFIQSIINADSIISEL